jgi:hypothetical protein
LSLSALCTCSRNHQDIATREYGLTDFVAAAESVSAVQLANPRTILSAFDGSGRGEAVAKGDTAAKDSGGAAATAEDSDGISDAGSASASAGEATTNELAIAAACGAAGLAVLLVVFFVGVKFGRFSTPIRDAPHNNKFGSAFDSAAAGLGPLPPMAVGRAVLPLHALSMVAVGGVPVAKPVHGKDEQVRSVQATAFPLVAATEVP